MASVRVEQRNAHLASSVRLEFVNGRDGKVAKGTLVAIANSRRGSKEERAEEATALQWTLWGAQAENAAEYLGKGSHVNIVGRLRNDHYTNSEGQEVYGFAFICEEIDYLDSKRDAEERRARMNGSSAGGEAADGMPAPATKAVARGRSARASSEASS